MKNYFKNKLKIYALFLLIISIFIGIYALLIYTGKMNGDSKSFNTSTFILGIFSFIVLGFLAGNSAQKGGLIEGLIAALFIILIALICNFFIKEQFSYRNFMKISSYLVASSLGGIIGVNFKSILRN